jgi:hypothetical protein
MDALSASRDAGEIDFHAWRKACSALPVKIRISAHIGSAYLRSLDVATSDDGSGDRYCHKPMASLESALAFLQANAILPD